MADRTSKFACRLILVAMLGFSMGFAMKLVGPKGDTGRSHGKEEKKAIGPPGPPGPKGDPKDMQCYGLARPLQEVKGSSICCGLCHPGTATCPTNYFCTPLYQIERSDCCPNYVKPECRRPCHRRYRPVCGNDGKTYSNSCLLKLAACRNSSLEIAYSGKCRPKNNCVRVCTAASAEFKPVCGTDRQTYRTLCHLLITQCSNPKLALSYYGRCKPDCVKVCSTEFKPVCGSNRQTYGNRCHLQLAQCKNSRLRLLHTGSCKRACGRVCPSNYDPICGKDGKTYSNQCNFLIARCRNPRLLIANKGRCKSDCESVKVCSTEFKPVCGSNRQTYGNRCHLQLAQCKNSRLRLLHTGSCKRVCRRICYKIYMPICGQDGTTYTNACFYRIARCKNPGLKVAYRGTCEAGRETAPLL